jgi:hypothetical protein
MNMKKVKLHLFLMPFGFILMSTAYYLSRHIQLTDFVTGLFSGAGLGLMIVAILKQRKSMQKRTDH